MLRGAGGAAAGRISEPDAGLPGTSGTQVEPVAASSARMAAGVEPAAEKEERRKGEKPIRYPRNDR